MPDKFGCLDLSPYDARRIDDDNYGHGPWGKEGGEEPPKKKRASVDPEDDDCGRRPDADLNVVDVEGETF